MKIFKVIIFLIFFIFFMRFSFLVRSVDCQIENGFLESGLCQKIEDNWKNKSLFFTDFANDDVWLEISLSEEYGQSYQLETVRRTLPNKLELNLSSKLASYRLKYKDQYFLLGQSNKLKKDQANLAIILIESNMDEDLIEGKYLKDAYHQKFISLVDAINNHEIELEKIIWKDDLEIRILLKKSMEVILDDKEDFDYQMKRLALILNDQNLKSDLDSKDFLDLRFKLPVLKD